MDWLKKIINALTVARQRQAEYMVKSMGGMDPIPEHVELREEAKKPAKKTAKKTAKKKTAKKATAKKATAKKKPAKTKKSKA